MFKSILLPVDLSDRARRAVDFARRFASLHDGSVILLHVIETIRDVPFEDLEEFYRRLEGKARTGMSELGEPLRQAGLEVEQIITYGRRTQEIVAHARNHAVDLILLASRRLDPADPSAAWASISHQVALLADCPVLLIKQDPSSTED